MEDIPINETRANQASSQIFNKVNFIDHQISWQFCLSEKKVKTSRGSNIVHYEPRYAKSLTSPCKAILLETGGQSLQTVFNLKYFMDAKDPLLTLCPPTDNFFQSDQQYSRRI